MESGVGVSVVVEFVESVVGLADPHVPMSLPVPMGYSLV